MNLRNMLNKFRNAIGGNPEKMHTPVSPDETELQVYLKRERDKKLKKLVHKYRNKETKEFLQGDQERSLMTKEIPIMTTPSRTGKLDRKQQKELKKHKNLLGMKNLFK